MKRLPIINTVFILVTWWVLILAWGQLQNNQLAFDKALCDRAVEKIEAIDTRVNNLNDAVRRLGAIDYALSYVARKTAEAVADIKNETKQSFKNVESRLQGQISELQADIKKLQQQRKQGCW